ncbi:MAG: leucine-rich repeat domain-containing protein [Defluviitaleaceae bacterium]|nr:leucine-rich repeat domain-containing protein [Defluviitaleaceae bacterium]
MNCKKCGNSISPTAVFCGSCGNPTGQQGRRQSKSPVKFIVAGISATAIIAIIAVVVLFLPLGEIGETGLFAQLLAQFGDNGGNLENYTETGELPESGENGESEVDETETEEIEEPEEIAELAESLETEEVEREPRPPSHINVPGRVISTSLTELMIDAELNPQYASMTDSDIANLQYMTNLTSLTIRGTQISDLSPLANLTTLTSLDLAGNQISDLLPLANLHNLNWLNLRNNSVADWLAVNHVVTVLGRPIVIAPEEIERVLFEHLSQHRYATITNAVGTVQSNGFVWIDGETMPASQAPERFVGFAHVFSDDPWWRLAFEDRHGNEITDTIYHVDDGGAVAIATDFALIDLDNDGVPELFVFYFGMGLDHTRVYADIYQYVGGTYQLVGTLYNLGNRREIFHSNDGRAVIREFRGGGPAGMSASSAYLYIDILDGNLQTSTIAEWGWYEDIWGDGGVYHFYSNPITGAEFRQARPLPSNLQQMFANFDAGQAIPGMSNVTFTPIPTSALEERLRTSLISNMTN